jgi:cytochrome c peroxidase
MIRTAFISLLAFLIGTPVAQASDSSHQAALARALNAPSGLPEQVHPNDNQPTLAKVILGRKLFFDRRLSLNGTMSCAMCHIPEQGFANNELARAVGLGGLSTKRNAPTLINVGYYKQLFFDGRETSLETQFIAPMISANEMANPSIGFVVQKLSDLDDYAELFKAAFSERPSIDRIGKALGAYQRTLVAANSRFDQWRYQNKKNALSNIEKAGFELFTGKAGCAQCHSIQANAASFTDERFHDTTYGWWREQQRQKPEETQRVQVAPGVFHQVPMEIVMAVGDPPEPDLGRYEVTLNPKDLWQYRTPSLRNIALTAPYMHDGGLTTLRDVVLFYNKGGFEHEQQSELIKPLELTNDQVNQIVAFLNALTGSNIDALISQARLQRPDNPNQQPQ